MYVMYPVARPIAELLDFCLGEQHGTIYRKSELKTFVALHQNGGIESLDEDEVTIIQAVLDLKEKPVSAIMTPLEDTYTLSADHILDRKSVNEIMSAGYSRIPIYEPPDPTNFIGMLLVKKLITYDPEDELPVREFSLNPLPETAPDVSCLDILNYFQEGRSHMVMVSEDPGGEGGALGVVTLEDVIEELIGEEIIDETDVYVDVRNKVKVTRRPPRQIRARMYPVSFLPKHRVGNQLRDENFARMWPPSQAGNHARDDKKRQRVSKLKRPKNADVTDTAKHGVYGTTNTMDDVAAWTQPVNDSSMHSLEDKPKTSESSPLLRKK